MTGSSSRVDTSVISPRLAVGRTLWVEYSLTFRLWLGLAGSLAIG